MTATNYRHLYVLRHTSELSKLLLGGPQYLRHVSRSGRTTRWVADPLNAAWLTRQQRDKLVRQHGNSCLPGRWITVETAGRDPRYGTRGKSLVKRALHTNP